MLEITSRLGDGWLPIFLKPDVYKEKVGILRNYTLKAGRNADEITPAVILGVIMDEDCEEVEKMLKTPVTKNTLITLYHDDFTPYGLSHPLGKNVDGSLEFIPTHYDRGSLLQILEKIPVEMCHDFYLNGSPDEIIGQIENYGKIGAKHIILFNVSILCGLKYIPRSNKCMKKIISYFKN